MLRCKSSAIAVFAGVFLAAPVAGADTLEVFDQSGAKVEMKTEDLAGCAIVFDSAGTPFEICRMKRVEVAPPTPARSRPGQTTKSGAAEPVKAAVIYTKVDE